MTDSASENHKKKSKESWGQSLRFVFREYAEGLVIAIVLALILRFFVISAYYVPTDSMVPTLKPGDFVLAYKLPYGLSLPFSSTKLGGGKPDRGDVVVFRCPYRAGQSCIKRVVALPGDRVEIIKKRLFVNDSPASYDQLGGLPVEDLPQYQQGYVALGEKVKGTRRSVLIGASKKGEFFGPFVVPPGHFFVLGDNRDEAEDSRKWGAIPVERLEARVLMVWMSFDWGQPEPKNSWPNVRWTRVFTGVD